MKKAIPKEWVDIIKIENSKRSVVNIFRNYVVIKGKPFKFSIQRNKKNYELLLNEKFINTNWF
jgi:hypothetical protein